MKKLLYISAFNFPSNNANSIQIIYNVKEFSRFLGSNFLFITGSIDNKEDFKDVNYLETSFKRGLVPLSIKYFFWLLIYFLKNRLGYHSGLILYFKDSYLCSIAIFLRKVLRFRYRIVFELHDSYRDWRDKYIINNIDFVIVLTKSLNRFVYSIKSKLKCLVASDGVNLEEFKKALPVSRKELNIPKNKKIIGFAGSFVMMGRQKGIEELLKAFQILEKKRNNIFLFCVGGRKEHVDFYKKKAKSLGINPSNFLLCEWVERKKLLSYYAICDILTMPLPATSDNFSFFNSPMKMFDYMAAKKPIISSDLPSIREVLDESNCIFHRSGDATDLANKIEMALDDSLLAEKIIEASYQKVKNYTWERRVKNIINFLGLKNKDE